MAEACEIIRQAALGLECVHRAGLVHRDIKPSNLMVHFDHEEATVKVLDLGLARLDMTHDPAHELTAEGQMMGTVDYMAPEQADGGEVGPWSDIYSLGATLYKLLAGVSPYADSGRGLYAEEVDDPDQTLDDAEIYYAVVGHVILLRIRPYQESIDRYIIYNEKIQQARRIDSLRDACILLPTLAAGVWANADSRPRSNCWSLVNAPNAKVPSPTPINANAARGHLRNTFHQRNVAAVIAVAGGGRLDMT